MIEFTVHGIPAPQGSKVRNRYGGIREANVNTLPWRAAVADKAAETMAGIPLLEGALVLEVYFHFPRPKSHYRTGKHAGVLKDTAPMFHATKPDVDKLVRAIGDALTGQVVRDDAQFSGVVATKLYGEKACAHVIVREVMPVVEDAIRTLLQRDEAA